MKKIYIILLVSLVFLSQNLFSQERHRLTKSKEPYDIFYTFKPYYLIPKGDYLPKNYNIGAGMNFGLEYQFQEIKLGIGVELGYAIINPNTYKIKYLPKKHLFAAHQVPFSIYTNYYLLNQESYYNFWDRLKPYVGVGLSAIWGRYDYSLSNEDNKKDDVFGYYLRDYEGQAGIRLGFLSKAGLLISGNNHAFGFEFGYQHYFAWDRLEPQQHITYGFTYIYIMQ